MKRAGFLVTLVLSLVVLSASSGVAVTTALPDPVAYWSFDGGNANDDSGNGHNGILYGKPVFVEGVKGKGKALRLNSISGSGDYVKVPWSEEFRGESFTLSAWVQLDGDCSLGDSVFSIPSWTTSDNAWHLIYRCESNKMHLDAYYYPGFHLVNPSFDLRWNWHQVVMIKDGTKGRLYIDGKVVATTQNLQPVMQYGNPRNILIGADDDSRNDGLGDTHWFRGIIDDVRLYDAALSAEQVQGLYTEAVQIAEAVEDTHPPTGAVNAYDNVLWSPNNKPTPVVFRGYVFDEMSVARDGGGCGVSSAYLMVNGEKVVLKDESTSVVNSDCTFEVTRELLAVKGAVYPIELYAADTNPESGGGANSGLVWSTSVTVPHDMRK